MVDLVDVDKLALVHDLVGKLGNGGGGLKRFQLDLARAGLALRDDGVTVVICERQEGFASGADRMGKVGGWEKLTNIILIDQKGLVVYDDCWFIWVELDQTCSTREIGSAKQWWKWRGEREAKEEIEIENERDEKRERERGKRVVRGGQTEGGNGCRGRSGSGHGTRD
jgi:hypothetical protein